jgi:hypothetical protein
MIDCTEEEKKISKKKGKERNLQFRRSRKNKKMCWPNRRSQHQLVSLGRGRWPLKKYRKRSIKQQKVYKKQ